MATIKTPIVYFCCTLISIFLVNILSIGLASSEQSRPTAIVTDTAGRNYKVFDLKTYYRFMGVGAIGYGSYKGLIYAFGTQEDRIEVTKSISIPLSEIDSIEFEEIDQFLDPKSVVIKKYGGSVTVLSKDNDNFMIEDKDRTGKVIGKRSVSWWNLSTRGLKKGEDVPLHLDSFKGRAKTQAGEEGDFEVSLKEVKRITFEKQK
jgi:hypothetical protein